MKLHPEGLILPFGVFYGVMCMSNKVFKWLIADLFFVGIITLLFFWIKGGAMSIISNETARTITNTVLWIIYGIADFMILIWFIYYWWCERTWEQMKRWANQQFKVIQK